MELKDFIEKFASQFEETEAGVFQANTKFKELDEWTSLTALSVIAMIDDEYEVAVKGNDIKNAETVEDLYNIVKSKK
ncbi:MAG: acyl carrier protein [Dysgonamonadaceae bacterium]|jgi:acyl carrier protein|nr:acyl carrier protein [Dysgonamonadaceae bacterium]